MATVYVYREGDLVKVGSTKNLKARLYQLRWGGRAEYAGIGDGSGEIIAQADVGTIDDAVQIERFCQDLLDSHRVKLSRRGGRGEWFRVDESTALRAFNSALATDTIPLALPQDVRDSLARMKRNMDMPSINAVLVELMERHIPRAEAERRNMAASELMLTFARDGLERVKCITVVTRKQIRP